MCEHSKRAPQGEPIRVPRRRGPPTRRVNGPAPERDRNVGRLTAEERQEVAEIVGLLAERPRQFRLQFLSGASAAEPAVRDERSVWALDASAAADMAADAPLPEGATRLRVVDLDGRTVFERETAEAARA